MHPSLKKFLSFTSSNKYILGSVVLKLPKFITKNNLLNKTPKKKIYRRGSCFFLFA